MKKIIESVKFEDAQLQKAYSDYMYTRDMTDCDEEAGADDLALVSLRYLKQHGKLDKLGQIPGDGRSAIKINVHVDGENEVWLLMINNEGGEGALKGSVTDALSGRAYPYAIMRLSGSGDPLETTRGLVPEGGKQSQKEITSAAAREFSEYARRLGIATGLADELYHPGFADAHMENAAVLSAAPAVNMRAEEPEDGDIVISLSCDDADDAEGDSGAAYLRRMRRLFALSEIARMIKCCDVEDGLIKCVISPENEDAFRAAAAAEGLDASESKAFGAAEVAETDAETEVEAAEGIDADVEAEVAESADNEVSADAETEERINIVVEKAGAWQESYLADESLGFADAMRRVAEDLNTCSGRGLTERFDSTAGSRTVMMPLGGINQLTPMQSMVHKLPVQHGATDDCTLAAWGYNPYISEASPYHGGYLAVIESIAKLVATGASFNEIYLSIRRNFADEDQASGAEIAALLGAFEAEMGLGIPAISESRGGSEMPSLISYAVTTGKASELISPEFKGAGHKVVMLVPETDKDPASAYYGLPTPESLKAVWRKAYELIANGRVLAAYTPGIGGTAEAIMKMSYGEGVGFEFAGEGFAWSDSADAAYEDIFDYSYGSIILEMSSDDPIKSRSARVLEIGRTAAEHIFRRGEESVSIGELMMLYEGKLESVFPANADSGLGEVGNFGYFARSWHTPIFKRAMPKVLIPAFTGAAGADDVVRAVRNAGGAAELLVLPTGSEEESRQSAERLAEGIKNSQIIVLTSAYSHLFRDAAAAESLTEFLDRKDGLMLGIGEGFRALTELGLLPYGRILGEDEELEKAELIINTLGAHQSRIARVCVASNKSPWLRSNKPGSIYSLPVSNTMGRFTASDEMIKRLSVNGQIATQYVDDSGKASTDIRFNPSGSAMAVEGICSEDGRVLGRMGRVERFSDDLYRNVPGRYVSELFENGVRYFK